MSQQNMFESLHKLYEGLREQYQGSTSAAIPGFHEVIFLLWLHKNGKPMPAMKGKQVLGVTDAAMTYMQNKLSKAGLITRVHDNDDRRKVLVGLSDNGLGVVEKFMGDHE